jgi:hypothetical protein
LSGIYGNPFGSYEPRQLGGNSLHKVFQMRKDLNPIE